MEIGTGIFLGLIGFGFFYWLANIQENKMNEDIIRALVMGMFGTFYFQIGIWFERYWANKEKQREPNFKSRKQENKMEIRIKEFKLLLTQQEVNDLEGEMLYEYSVVFSAFPFTNEDLARKRFEPFIMNAQREGIEL